MKKETYWTIIQSDTIKMASTIALFVAFTLAASIILTSCSSKGQVYKSPTNRGCSATKGMVGYN